MSYGHFSSVTPPLGPIFLEQMKSSVSAPQYDVATFMSSDFDPVHDQTHQVPATTSVSDNHQESTYNPRSGAMDGINSSGAVGVNCDLRLLDEPLSSSFHNFASHVALPITGSTKVADRMPQGIGSPSRLQPDSSRNEPPSYIVSSTEKEPHPPHIAPSSPCTCVSQALGLLATLHDPTNSHPSSTSPTPPSIRASTYPACGNMLASNAFESLPNGPSFQKKTATAAKCGTAAAADTVTITSTNGNNPRSIHDQLAINTAALKQATSILTCACSATNQQLVFFIAFIALKIMDRYATVVYQDQSDCNAPHRHHHHQHDQDANSQHAATKDAVSVVSSTNGRSNGGGDHEGSIIVYSTHDRAQLVLGELHRVVRMVDTLSKRIHERREWQDMANGASPRTQWDRVGDVSKDSLEKAGGCPRVLSEATRWGISVECIAKLERDLRTRLRAVTSDTMAILRSGS